MSVPNLLFSLFVQAPLNFYKGKRKNYLISRDMGQITSSPVLSDILEKKKKKTDCSFQRSLLFPSQFGQKYCCSSHAPHLSGQLVTEMLSML